MTQHYQIEVAGSSILLFVALGQFIHWMAAQEHWLASLSYMLGALSALVTIFYKIKNRK